MSKQVLSNEIYTYSLASQRYFYKQCILNNKIERGVTLDILAFWMEKHTKNR